MKIQPAPTGKNSQVSQLAIFYTFYKLAKNYVTKLNGGLHERDSAKNYKSGLPRSHARHSLCAERIGWRNGPRHCQMANRIPSRLAHVERWPRPKQDRTLHAGLHDTPPAAQRAEPIAMGRSRRAFCTVAHTLRPARCRSLGTRRDVRCARLPHGHLGTSDHPRLHRLVLAALGTSHATRARRMGRVGRAHGPIASHAASSLRRYVLRAERDRERRQDRCEWSVAHCRVDRLTTLAEWQKILPRLPSLTLKNPARKAGFFIAQKFSLPSAGFFIFGTR